jgi:hypothetical protein
MPRLFLMRRLEKLYIEIAEKYGVVIEKIPLQEAISYRI